jgi:hypothetical protein
MGRSGMWPIQILLNKPEKNDEVVVAAQSTVLTRFSLAALTKTTKILAG